MLLTKRPANMNEGNQSLQKMDHGTEHAEGATPLISVIIPTINRYADLENTLNDLSKQSLQQFEVIIIDQTIPGKKKIITREDLRLSYFWTEVPSASAARNLGIIHAKAAILLFLDDDVIISDADFLRYYYNAYQENKEIPGIAGCVLANGQTVRNHRHKLSYRKNTGWLFFPQNYGQRCLVAGGRSCNLSVRRDVAIKVGGMDENYQKGAHREEADFCMRVVKDSGQFLFLPEACLVHIGNPEGGIRNWDSKSILKAQHHYDGAVYFILRNVPLSQLPLHLLVTFLFFFKKKFMKRPQLYVVSFWRLLLGLKNAIILKRKGPQFLVTQALTTHHQG